MKKKNRLIQLGLIFAFIFGFVQAENAWASSSTFTAGTGSWNTAGNWNNGVPGPTDDVIIGTGCVLTLSADATCASLTFQGTGQLIIAGYTLTVNGDIAYGTAVPSLNLNNGNLVITGALPATANAVSANGTTTTGTRITFNGSTNAIVPAAITTLHSLTVNKSGGGNITTSGALTIAGTSTLDVLSGTLIVGNFDLTVAGQTNVAAGATLDLIGTGLTAPHTADFNGPIVGGGTIIANGTDGTNLRIVNLDGAFTFTGPFNTNNYTTLNVGGSTADGDISLPSTISALAYLDISPTSSRVVTLNADLALAAGAAITTSGLNIGANGTFNTNTKNITISTATGDAGAVLTNAGILNASGSLITLNNNSVLSGAGTYNTSNTNLTINSTGNQTFHANFSQIKNLIISAVSTVSLGSDYTINGNLTISAAGTLDCTPGANDYSLIVYGILNNSAGTILAPNSTTKSITLNGPITAWGTFTEAATTVVNIGGSGAISANMPTAANVLYSLTMNRTGQTLTLANNVVLAGDLSVTTGTVATSAANTLGIDGTTTISPGGTLDLSSGAGVKTFGTAAAAGSLTGTGTLKATGTATVLINGTYSFTGSFLTDATTILQFDRSATAATLNPTVLNLAQLVIGANTGRVVTLSNNLTIATTFTLTNGSVVAGPFTFTSPAYTGAAGGTLDLRGTTAVFTGACNFTLGTLQINSTSNLTINAAMTLPAATALSLKNFTLQTAGTLTMTGDLTTAENLNVFTGSTLTTGDYNVTVGGAFTNTGTLTASAMTATKNFSVNGAVNGNGTYTTSNTFNIIVNGTGTALNLPANFGATNFRSITLNRASGMIINSNLTVGTALVGVALNLTSGDLDLNGYAITLGAATATINETVGNTFINTGAEATGYVTLANPVTDAQAINSGIGVDNIVTGGNITLLRRYPKYAALSGVGLGVSRYYGITTASAITSIKLRYDNTELNGNSAGNLKLYTASNTSFTTMTADSGGTSNANTPYSGIGNVDFTTFAGVAGTYYITFASQATTGVVKMFNNAGSDLKWSNVNNWSPIGLPTVNDDVVIGGFNVIMDGNGQNYAIKSLTMNNASSSIKPYATDTVNLKIMGNITINALGAALECLNSYGRINVQIGDGITPVTAVITAAQDYSAGNGIQFHTFTLKGASATLAGDYQVRVTGNLDLLGASSLAPSAVSNRSLVMYGGFAASQAINIANIANLNIDNLIFANNANVTTTANYSVNKELKLSGPGDIFLCNNGTATFQTGANITGWDVYPGATLRFWNLEINNSANTVAPVGNCEISGNFNKVGAGVFQPVIGTDIMFKNTGQSEISNASAAASLVFSNLRVANGTKVITSSSFYIRGTGTNNNDGIEVLGNGSLRADNGTIRMTGAAGEITNYSNQTLVFNNLDITGTLISSTSDFKIAGNLTVLAGGTLQANNGTITFENLVQKTIENSGGATVNLVFHKLAVSDASKVLTSTAHDFTIANNTTYPTGAGIDIQGTGWFEVNSATGVTTFNVLSDPGTGNPKVITKSSNGTLKFNKITIANGLNNDVTTASDFELTGAGATVFNNANSGTGGTFEATAGNITFSGAIPVINSVAPNNTKFYSFTANNVAVTLDPDDYIDIKGNVYVNGTIGQFLTSATGATGFVKFNGTSQQLLTGTGTSILPLSIARMIIDKSGATTTDKEVLMQLPLTLVDGANTILTLSSGYLNLGDKVLTVGAGNFTYTTLGAINGGTGTYKLVNTATGVLFQDEMFTPAGMNPTLYNLILAMPAAATNETIDDDLTINNNLTLTSGQLTIANNKILKVFGNMTRTSGVFVAGGANSNIVLTGTGATSDFRNAYFNAGTAMNIEIGRAEVLTGNLSMTAGALLKINTGINSFDISQYTLNLTAATIKMLSGGILAPTTSSVVMNNSITTIPANLFRNNQCGTLTIGTNMTLGGDLSIMTALNGLFTITTGENVLTFGPNITTIPVFNSTTHIKGNLKQTVKSSTPTTYWVGDFTLNTYRPLTMKFANIGSTLPITVSSTATDPTIGRGGNPKNALDITWTITPDATSSTDSLLVSYQWDQSAEGTYGQAAVANASFPAKWIGTSWKDYRYGYPTFNSTANPRILSSTSYPIKVSEIAGVWGVFNASANTDVAKDAAISTSANKVMITKINPLPVKNQFTFKVTVQLQDRYGQPIVASTPFSVTVSQILGTAALTSSSGVILPGNSSVDIIGSYATATNGESGHQLQADTTGGSSTGLWQPTVSELFAVFGDNPTVQTSNITFTNKTNTSVTINWVAGTPANTIVIAKADTLLQEGYDFPVNGTPYLSNTIYGAGSSIGNAAVLYKGAGTSVDITGLSPATTYYVYAFAYNNDGAAGNENYKLLPQTFASFTTTGTYDDDVTFGPNDTREQSVTIGANTTVKGTIKSAVDVDWYNFSVTNASPNVRVIISNLSKNFNVEIYDANGRRLRRGILPGTTSDYVVVNNLPAGTYTVKIYGVDGAFDVSNYYILQVNTKTAEIYSVTP